MLVHGRESEPLLQYSRAILGFLKHHQATINMNNCKWFHNHCEFVGVDVGDHDNSLSKSKYATFELLEPPSTCANLRMLIGVFVFYSKHLPRYKLRLIPWRSVLAAQPRPGEVTQAEGKELMESLCTV